MKNVYYKIICAAISLVMMFATLAGCNASQGAKTMQESEHQHNHGTLEGHDDNVVGTGDYIVKNGVSDYSILVPADKDYNIDIAADEIVNAIKETCGYTMNVTSVYDDTRKYISLDKTQLYLENENRVLNNKPLEYTETKVSTIDKNVFIIGYDTEYTAYSAYEFLERLVGFNVWTMDEISVNKSDAIEFLDMDVREKPDVAIRYPRFFPLEEGGIDKVRLNSRRLRVDCTSDSYFTYGHNVIGKILPKSMYLADHPEWYSKPVDSMTASDIGQLCLSNEEMTAEFIARVKTIIMNSDDIANKKFFMLGMEDNWDYCNCANCQKMEAENNGVGKATGKRSCNAIIFANKVEKAINDDWDWLKENYPGKQIQFVIFGYMHNAAPPVVYNNANVPVAANSRVIANEHVSVLYAAIGANYQYALSDSRSPIGKQFKEWEAVCQNIMYYGYCAQFAACPVPYNDLVTMDGTVNFIIEKGGYYYQDQGATLTKTSGLEELRYYVKSKMLWDASKSVDEYAYEFIDYYYMPVADIMKRYYNAFTAYQRLQAEELNVKVYPIDDGYISAANWKKGFLDNVNRILDEAIAELEPLKATAMDKYEKFFNRVNKEKIWIYYLYCSNYKTYFNDVDYTALIDFMRYYCPLYEVKEYREYRSISEKFDQWQIK